MLKTKLYKCMFLVAAATLTVALIPTGVAFAASVRETSVDIGSGWMTAVAVDPSLPSRVFSSTAYLTDPAGGLFRSVDRGGSWTQLFSPLPVEWSMGSLALETAGSTVYAGGGVGTRGIFKSTNAGDSWSTLLTWTGDEKVRDVVVDPADNKRIFAVTEQWDDAAPNLRYSIDGGSTWVARAIETTGNDCRAALCTDIGTGGRMLVGGENVYWVSGPTGGGVFVSDDLGVSWTRTGCLDLDVTGIAACPSNRDIVYACARMAAETGVLYKSTDGGDTFLPVTMPSNASAVTVEVDSLGRVFVGSGSGSGDMGGMHQSDDGGATWTQVGSFTSDQTARVSDLDPAGCFLYEGTYTGVSRYWVPSAEEVFGSTRFATAVQVSRTVFPAADSASTVVVVSGLNFPDAAVAGPFATSRDGVILLSRGDGLDSATIAEIDRVLPTGGDVYIIGGTAAVPGSVDTVLSGKGYDVVRIAGRDRFATSVAVASELGTPTACFMANGTAFPDILSASAPAADHGIPILLTRTDEIPSSVSTYLESCPDTLTAGYIAGDSGVVGESVGTALESWVDEVVRLGGRTRYDTSLAIAKRFYPVPTDAAGVATGVAYPDGLTGSVLCALRGGPLLLTKPSDLPDAIGSYLKTGEPDAVTFFGGRAAIGIDARYEFEALW